MLQVVLALIALATVAVMGFAMQERLAVTHLNSDYDENIRRLDRAASSLEAQLVVLPGTGAQSPVAASAGANYSELPSTIGKANVATYGRPFVYCPIGAVSSSDINQSGGGFTGTVTHSSTYTVTLRDGYVLASNLALDSSWSGWERPLAFIILPSRSGAVPSCASVKRVNGKPVVANGTVRAIFSSTDPFGTNTASSNQERPATVMYVSGNGSGKGTGSDDFAPINAAIAHFTSQRPERFILVVDGAVAVDASKWADFTDSSGRSGSELAIVGTSASAVIEVIGSATYEWRLRGGDLTLDNIGFENIQLTVQDGSRLSMTGQVALNNSAHPPAASIIADSGGDVTLKSATLTVQGSPSTIAVWVNGTFKAFESVIRTAGGNAHTLIYGASKSDVTLFASVLGGVDTGFRPANTDVQFESEGYLTMDSSSTAYRATGSGVCWFSSTAMPALDPAFLADNGAGVSTVRGYETFSPTSFPGGFSAYNTAMVRLARAIEFNQSSAACPS